MGLKELLLKKGWAGTTISRQETADRLNPIIATHYALFHSYEDVIGRHGSRDVVARLEAFQKVTRADIGKLAESVLSAGGVPYNGTDLEPEQFRTEGDAADAVRRLVDLEENFLRTLDAELKENHQIRTRAVLGALRRNSADRLAYLQSLA